MDFFKKSLIVVGLVGTLGFAQICQGIVVNFIYGKLGNNVDICLIGDWHGETADPKNELNKISDHQFEAFQKALAMYTNSNNTCILREAGPTNNLDNEEQEKIIKDKIAGHTFCRCCLFQIQCFMEYPKGVTELFLSKKLMHQAVITLEQRPPSFNSALKINLFLEAASLGVLYFNLLFDNEFPVTGNIDSLLEYYQNTLQALQQLSQNLSSFSENNTDKNKSFMSQKLWQGKILDQINLCNDIIKKINQIKNAMKERNETSFISAILNAWDYQKATVGDCFLCNLEKQENVLLSKLSLLGNSMINLRKGSPGSLLELQAMNHILQVLQRNNQATVIIVAGFMHCLIINEILQDFIGCFTPLFAVGDFYDKLPWVNPSDFLKIQKTNKLVKKLSKLVYYYSNHNLTHLSLSYTIPDYLELEKKKTAN
jgi:hypothetical protein